MHYVGGGICLKKSSVKSLRYYSPGLRYAGPPSLRLWRKEGRKINRLTTPLCACAERVTSAAKSGE
jgi:hypothetical protein